MPLASRCAARGGVSRSAARYYSAGGRPQPVGAASMPIVPPAWFDAAGDDELRAVEDPTFTPVSPGAGGHRRRCARALYVAARVARVEVSIGAARRIWRLDALPRRQMCIAARPAWRGAIRFRSKREKLLF